jgi:hypothetical protein
VRVSERIAAAAAAAGEFADANEELLKTLPPPLVAAQYYLRCAALPAGQQHSQADAATQACFLLGTVALEC